MRVLKVRSAGAQEAPGPSRSHQSICLRAEVGQHYLDFCCPMGVSFNRFSAIDKGDGVR